MHSITVILLIVLAHAGFARDSTDQPVDRLYRQADEDLGNTTLGTPRLASPRQVFPVAPRSVQSRPTAQGRVPALRRSSHAGQTANARSVAVLAYRVREWPATYDSMLGKLKPISGAEALKMTKALFNPATLVDVRVPRLYSEAAPEGSVNVPLFLPVEGFSLKRLVTNSMGIEATDRNPEFEELARKQIPKGKPVILACNRGGIFKKGERMDNLGTYTQSLRAAAALYDEGYTNIFFLKDGIDQWAREGLPMAGDEDLAALQTHDDIAKYCIPGLFVLASFTFVVALIRRRFVSISQDAVHGLGESLMHA